MRLGRNSSLYISRQTRELRKVGGGFVTVSLSFNLPKHHESHFQSLARKLNFGGILGRAETERVFPTHNLINQCV